VKVPVIGVTVAVAVVPLRVIWEILPVVAPVRASVIVPVAPRLGETVIG
jgi:hypothetical protein